MQRSFLLLSALVMLNACLEVDDTSPPLPSGALVYAPVYALAEVVYDISISEAKPIENPSKIFTYRNFLMINIKDEGIHVIDNSLPSSPQQLFFINIPGNNDVSVKDGVLYADNYNDIVAFQIDSNHEVEILERLAGVMNNRSYPPHAGVYFKCVDPSKGVVVDWVKVDDQIANCYRP
ncbi:MAG: hypothetical protein JXQ90_13470 [Cyclobacteriaceae bacterium]